MMQHVNKFFFKKCISKFNYQVVQITCTWHTLPFFNFLTKKVCSLIWTPKYLTRQLDQICSRQRNKFFVKVIHNSFNKMETPFGQLSKDASFFPRINLSTSCVSKDSQLKFTTVSSVPSPTFSEYSQRAMTIGKNSLSV